MDVLCSPHYPRLSSSPEPDHLQSGGRHLFPCHLNLLQLSKRKQDKEMKDSSLSSKATLQVKWAGRLEVLAEPNIPLILRMIN